LNHHTIAGVAGGLRVGTLWLDSTLCLRAIDPMAARIFGVPLQLLPIGKPLPEASALPAAFRIWLSRAAMDSAAPMRWSDERCVCGISPAMGGGWLAWVIDRSSLGESDSQLDEILSAIPSPVFYKDLHGRYLGCNAAFERYSGLPRHELVGKSASDIAATDLAEVYRDTDRALVEDGEAQQYQAEVRFADGLHHEIVFHKALFRNRAGEPGGIVGVMLDITEQKRLERELRLAASVFDNAAEAITITDDTPRILKVNRAFTEITGYSAAEVTGQNPSMLSSGRQDQSFYRNMWRQLRDEGHWFGEIVNRRKNGEFFPEYLSISAVKGADGTTSNYIGIFTDISQEKNSAERIERLSLFDPLTELPNRTLLTDRLQQAMSVAGRRGHYCALLFVGVEGLRQINDSLGYETGDQTLRAVAQRLQTVLRNGDTVARYMGDQFVVLLADLLDPGDAAVVAGHVLNSLALPMALQGHELVVGASIGISIFPRDGGDALSLVRAADVAMHHAKREGRNIYQFFSRDLEHASLERLMLEGSLRQALERNEFIVHYQPLVDFEHDAITGVEALVRWQHPEMGLVPPGRFIPLAEESGLILAIGEWVLGEACRQGQRWLDAGHSLTVAVNVSARQFRQRDFADRVQAILAETGLPPGLLELEVTESMVMDDPERAVTALRCLRDMGVRVSIDDFGTGYSSLSYLKRFEIDKLKIDRSFISDIPNDANDMAIAEAVIAMGRSLKLRVVAEGVETEGQLEFLRDKGCHGIQGFYFSPPVNADIITGLLGRRLTEPQSGQQS
jgi:diguanylate cyclase (GGDEF)-like protein/PAS domain S-box-containing protein